jgi:hypothetical protein
MAYLPVRAIRTTSPITPRMTQRMGIPNTVEEGAVGGVVVPDGGGATTVLYPPIVVKVLLDVWLGFPVPTGGPPVDSKPGPLDTGEPWLSASSWEVVSLEELVVVTFDFSALLNVVR